MNQMENKNEKLLIIEERFCGKTYSAQNHMLKGNNYSEITTVNNLVFWLKKKKNRENSVHTPRLGLCHQSGFL